MFINVPLRLVSQYDTPLQIDAGNAEGTTYLARGEFVKGPIIIFIKDFFFTSLQ